MDKFFKSINYCTLLFGWSWERRERVERVELIISWQYVLYWYPHEG